MGEPTLLFVHGFGCDGSDWNAQIHEFRGRHRVIAPDLPGHGAAPHRAGDRFETLVTALLDVRARDGGRSVALIGHSLGCRVILEAVARGCPGVAGLVLIEQNIVGGENAQLVADRVQTVAGAIGVQAFLRPAFQAMFNEASPPQLRERVLERLERLDPDFAQRVLIESIRWEASEAMRLARVDMPVLLIQSTYLDESFRWHNLQPGMSTPWTRLVMREVPRAQLQIVSGPGHFAHIEAADRVNQHIRNFVEGLVTEAAARHGASRTS